MGYTELQETDASIVYTGTWGSVADTRASGGSYKQTSTIGDSANITFTGRALYLYSVATDTSSRATITVDGVPLGTISAAIAGQTPQGQTALVG